MVAILRTTMASEARSLTVWRMARDKRPALEQIKSGFLIVAKMLGAFGIAVTFLTGTVLIRTPRYSYDIALGWLLIIVSVVVMTTTVRFWAAGFGGFVAYGAWRSLGGILFAGAYQVSRLYMGFVSASMFAMAILCFRFTSKKVRITPIDRASVVIAASCVLVAVLFGDTYKSIAVFNVGNLALFLLWWASRVSRHSRHRKHTASAVTA
jgi:hypothetical protein